MTDRWADSNIAEMEGAAGLPRKNGELVFHDDWERRAFAMAVALCENGHYSWDEFRAHLIAAISASGETPEHPCPGEPGYYEHWMSSLEKVLAEKGLLQNSAPPR